MLAKIKYHKMFVVFSLGYFCFSLLTYKDYGITSDEEVNYRAGSYYFRFLMSSHSERESLRQRISEKDDPLNFPHYRLYPALVSLLNFKGYYEWSHLINLVFGFLSFLFVYLITYALTKSRLSILSPIILFLNPHYLGHIPANPKDIPFSWMYLATIYFFLCYTSRKVAFYIYLGILIALTSAIRLVGSALFVFFVLKMMLDKSSTFKQSLVMIFITSTSALLFLYLTWPYIWGDPIGKLSSLIANSSDFSYWDRSILYKGILITKASRPWDYLIHYLVIKTPILILVGFLGSLVVSAKKLLPLYGILLINFAFYLIIQPVIYNEIRHFLFLIPVITVCSSVGYIKLLKNKRFLVPSLTAVVILLSLTKLTVDFVQLHPYQYVYFNELAGSLERASKAYELDYWSSSYKESAEYIRNIAKTSPYPIKVYPCNLAFGVDYYSYKGFSVVNKSVEADYYICDYMNTLKRSFSLESDIVYEIRRKGATLSYVAKTIK